MVRTEGKKGDLNVTMMSEDFKPGKEKGELRSDPVDVQKVKEKILEFIKLASLQVDEQSGLIQLVWGPSEKKGGLKEIFL